MNAMLRSSLLGALIAAVIYMVISTALDASRGNVIGFGLGLGVLTFAASAGLSSVMAKRHTP